MTGPENDLLDACIMPSVGPVKDIIEQHFRDGRSWVRITNASSESVLYRAVTCGRKDVVAYLLDSLTLVDGEALLRYHSALEEYQQQRKQKEEAERDEFKKEMAESANDKVCGRGDDDKNKDDVQKETSSSFPSSPSLPPSLPTSIKRKALEAKVYRGRSLLHGAVHGPTIDLVIQHCGADKLFPTMVTTKKNNNGGDTAAASSSSPNRFANYHHRNAYNGNEKEQQLVYNAEACRALLAALAVEDKKQAEEDAELEKEFRAIFWGGENRNDNDDDEYGARRRVSASKYALKLRQKELEMSQFRRRVGLFESFLSSTSPYYETLMASIMAAPPTADGEKEASAAAMCDSPSSPSSPSSSPELTVVSYSTFVDLLGQKDNDGNGLIRCVLFDLLKVQPNNFAYDNRRNFLTSFVTRDTELLCRVFKTLECLLRNGVSVSEEGENEDDDGSGHFCDKNKNGSDGPKFSLLQWIIMSLARSFHLSESNAKTQSKQTRAKGWENNQNQRKPLVGDCIDDWIALLSNYGCDPWQKGEDEEEKDKRKRKKEKDRMKKKNKNRAARNGTEVQDDANEEEERNGGKKNEEGNGTKTTLGTAIYTAKQFGCDAALRAEWAEFW